MLPPFDPNQAFTPTEQKEIEKKRQREPPPEIENSIESLEASSSIPLPDISTEYKARVTEQKVRDELDQKETQEKRQRGVSSIHEIEPHSDTPILTFNTSSSSSSSSSLAPVQLSPISSSSPGTETLEELCNRAARCFKSTFKGFIDHIQQQGPLNAINLLRMCNRCAKVRMRQTEPMTLEEIQEIHSIFFSPQLRTLSEQQISEPLNHLNPAPAYVFNSLNNCLSAIMRMGGCKEAIKSLETFCRTTMKPEPVGSTAFLLFEAKNQEEIDKVITDLRTMGEGGNSAADAAEKYLAEIKQYNAKLKSFPMVDTRRIFDSPNIHDTHALLEDGVEKWIFKPESGNSSQMCASEHIASQVNYHGAFKVPLTVMINIGGVSGSAQLVVPDCITLSTLTDNKDLGKIDLLDLQKTVIFDLLFGNMDRNNGNLLFQREGQIYRIFNIDHDQCFIAPTGKPLLLCYDQLPQLNKKFLLDIDDLISPRAVNEYERQMRINQCDEEAIQWMKRVAKGLSQFISENRTAYAIIKFYCEKWDQRIL